MFMQKKNKPRFNVPNLGFFGSVKARWRKPRGTHNKKRMKFKFMGASPRIGYRNPVQMRGVHPSGLKEVLVNNLKDLEGLKDVVLRVASGVGGKKRAQIAEKAKALHLRIVNMAGAGKEAKREFVKAGAKGESKSAKPQEQNQRNKTPKQNPQHGGSKPEQKLPPHIHKK